VYNLVNQLNMWPLLFIIGISTYISNASDEDFRIIANSYILLQLCKVIILASISVFILILCSFYVGYFGVNVMKVGTVYVFAFCLTLYILKRSKKFKNHGQ
jgi:hypothetical protein